MTTSAPLVVRFNDAKRSLPPHVPKDDDCRHFIFVEDGTPFCGMYLNDGIFVDTAGMVHNADAWIEWEEAPTTGAYEVPNQ